MFLFGTAFGIGLSTIVYLIFDSIIATDFRYVASGIISFLALCLAGFSAKKVSKWADSKLNESKYKAIDEIIDIQIDIQYNLRLSHDLIKFILEKESSEKNIIDICNKVKTSYESVAQYIFDLPKKINKCIVIGVSPDKYNHNFEEIINGMEAMKIATQLITNEKTRSSLIKRKEPLEESEEITTANKLIKIKLKEMLIGATKELVTFDKILKNIDTSHNP